MATKTYSITISTLTGTTPFFNGYFKVDNTNTIISFYDNNSPYTNILAPPSVINQANGSPDYKYYAPFQTFSFSGLNIYNNSPYNFPNSNGQSTLTEPVLLIEGVNVPTPQNEGVIWDVKQLTATNVLFVITYVPPPCFLKGSKILTNRGYIPVEQLYPGDLVKTVEHDYKRIEMIGYSQIYNPANTERTKNRLYRCAKSKYPSLFEDLIITGCHSILVGEFKEGEREKTEDVLGKIYVTDHKYRLPACVDKRADTYEVEGTFTIYHLALENDDYYMNYGIYANGLLVETCSRRYLKEISKMTLVEK